jgi:hypothetical protein
MAKHTLTFRLLSVGILIIVLAAGTTAYASVALKTGSNAAQKASLNTQGELAAGQVEPAASISQAAGSSASQDADLNTQNKSQENLPQNQNISQVTGEAGSSFQQSLKAAVAERQAQGLPVPASITFGTVISNTKAPQNSLTGGDQVNVLITSQTVVTMQNPAQAGYTKWPDLIFDESNLGGAKGFVKAGNYNQAVKDWLAGQFPGIWDQYEFGYEPRQFTFEETYQVQFSEAQLKIFAAALNAPDAATVEQILLGFTYEGPHYDYTIDEKFETCVIVCVTWAEFKAGFALDWGLGLRLPIEATLNSPDPVTEGTLFNPTTSIKGLDWSAADFSAVGVPPESGNEFVMRFELFLGGSIKILGDEILGAAIDQNISEPRSFATPIGSGASFPLPTLDVPVWQPSLVVASLTFGFGFKPIIDSDKVTAEWSAGGDATGSGSVTYTAPETPVSFGPVDPVNGPGQANLLLNHYQYWFNQFLMQISAYIDFDVFGFDAARIDIPITDFDLSFVTSGLFVEKHAGTSDNIPLSVSILDLPAVVNAGPDQTTDEGTLVSLAPATFIDLGVLDVHTATINWGDGTTEPGTLVESSGSGTVAGAHAYGDNGTYTVVVSVCEGTSCGSDSLVVTVNNVAPITNAGADLTVNEGAAVSLAPATFTDPGFLDTETATVTWGDGTPAEAGVVSFSAGSGTVSGTHTYLDNGLYTVTVEVCDDDGGCGADSLVVTVLNVPPTVSAIMAPSEKLVGAEITASASFTDPGIVDTHTAVWDWGDGTVEPGTLTQGAGFGSVEDTHTYMTCQVFTIVLTVTDDDGGVGVSDPHNITVLSPKDGVSRLMDMVRALGLDHGIENSLLAKLGNALDAMERGNYRPAENQLNAFINEVQAQSGKKINPSDADVLIQWAMDIINASQAGLCTP